MTWYYKAREVFNSKNSNDAREHWTPTPGIGKCYYQWNSQFAYILYLDIHKYFHGNLPPVGKKKIGNCPSIYISEQKALRQHLLRQDKLKIILYQLKNISHDDDCIHNNYKALLWMDKTGKLSM